MSDVPVFILHPENDPIRSTTAKCFAVTEKFQEVFGYYPDFIARSPGRVNLIGEHIDYEDFSVLPMAIDKSMLCVVRVIEESVEDNPSIMLYNDNPQFAQRKFDLPIDGSYISIDPSISDWSNYFKCGLHVAQVFLKKIRPDHFDKNPLCGLQVFCQGDVPTGGGLSSSAAFTCTVALLIIRANMGAGYKISKQDLMRITAVSEHYVGVNTGGMDQAACVCGEKDNALYVEFKPELTATPFKFPVFSDSKDIQFVIANTLVVSNKYETAPTNYNLRVVEDTIAANVLAAKHGLFIGKRALNSTDNSDNLLSSMEFASSPTIMIDTYNKGNLRDFMDAYFSINRSCSTLNLDNIVQGGHVDTLIIELTRMVELVEECFPNDNQQHTYGYTIDEIINELNCSREEFTREYLMVFPVRCQNFRLYQRAKHVFTEALRVMKAVKLMKQDDIGSSEDFFKEFGKLMNESQTSCRDLYNCSCEEIEEICQIARDNGSYGSRLTGAGWGGCTVHLVSSESDIQRVKTALIDNFYKKRYHDITEEQLEEAIIVSGPAMGCCIYEL